MKQLLALILTLITVITLFTGCGSDNNKEEIQTLLSESKYEDAYNIAESESDKKLIIAENLLALYCYNSNLDTEANLKLIEGYFDEVKASEDDKYTPNNSILAIENYAKLAEYISTLRKENILEDYYYCATKIEVDGETVAYGLASLSKENQEFKAISVWTSLEQDSDDSILEALYKYITKQLIADGVELNDEAVERINKNYLCDDPKKIEFEIEF